MNNKINRKIWISLFIVPFYKCNLNCYFCSVKNKNDLYVDLNKLSNTISLLKKYCIIRNIEILWGEPLIDENYIKILINFLVRLWFDKINLISNWIRLRGIDLISKYISVSISINYLNYKHVFKVLDTIEYKIKSFNLVIDPKFLTEIRSIGIDYFFRYLNKLDKLWKDVWISPVYYWAKWSDVDIYLVKKINFLLQEAKKIGCLKRVNYYDKVDFSNIWISIVPEGFFIEIDGMIYLLSNYYKNVYKLFFIWEKIKDWCIWKLQDEFWKKSKIFLRFLEDTWYLNFLENIFNYGSWFKKDICK